MSVFKMDPRCSARVLSSVPECKKKKKYTKTVVCLMEKMCLLGKPCSDLSLSAVGHEFRLMSQQYISNKVSLNINIHKTCFSVEENVNRCA